ncbi:hypothetical protein FND52_03700 [Atlantibacter subterranea]|uniref:hypothetical protein n=1 Tax=Atlantibacter subterraneus TaxID=255519 RepID=UPI001183CC71|nr:hypothetical protein [Atlantibacter subterranea]TSJ59547.1 hypothetical protein FND52_03700 [Atlantibacter subterranea]
MEQHTFRLPLEGIDALDKQQLIQLITRHAGIFERFVMSEFPGDRRYAYQPESFEIVSLDDSQFTFRCLTHYFEPCCDRNMHDEHQYTVAYQRDGDALVITLDETPWEVV